MDWLTFIAQIVGALAWPAVALVLLFWLRPHLAGLAIRVQSLKLPGGAEAQFFRDELEKAKTDVQSLPPPMDEPRTPEVVIDLSKIQQEYEQFMELTKSFPEASVLFSFQQVEQVLNEIAHKLDVGQGQPPRAVIEALRRRGLIDEQFNDLYKRLANLRNVAVHRGPVNLTQDEALEYHELASAAASQLRWVLQRL